MLFLFALLFHGLNLINAFKNHFNYYKIMPFNIKMNTTHGGAYLGQPHFEQNNWTKMVTVEQRCNSNSLKCDRMNASSWRQLLRWYTLILTLFIKTYHNQRLISCSHAACLYCTKAVSDVDFQSWSAKYKVWLSQISQKGLYSIKLPLL